MSVQRKKRDGSYHCHFRDYNGKQRAPSFGKGRTGKRKATEFDKQVKACKRMGLPLPDPKNPEATSVVEQQPSVASGQVLSPKRVHVATGPRESLYLDELAQKWINSLRAEGKGDSWLPYWVRILQDHILPELCTSEINALNQDDILAVMLPLTEGKRQSTRNRYMSYLKIMINFGVKHGYCSKNPLQHWQKAKEAPRHPEVTLDDVDAIYQHAAPHVQWALEVMSYTGARPGPSELFAMTWSNIDWSQRMLSYYASKVRKWVRIPLNDDFFMELAEKHELAKTPYIIEYNGKPVKSIKKAFANAVRRAGIEKRVCPYDIRHLFATNALNKGGDLKALSAFLSHSSTKMTADQYYMNMRGEMERMAQLLEGPAKRLAKAEQ
ncbi:site-specific integrase [Oceanidesulfovibrio indonesiensis]|uniref:Site-specific integrase n=1 Tax=Oceanidesulfovibrio indonesiensis TaxID=54767 RepID=A0A7M3MAA1_9BACT|nr:integrase [Oceanidesulfovibrio indonesiensis]TVM14542.1 site-specific integrase [Oceanidesulfovibrio indonesiensis]